MQILNKSIGQLSDSPFVIAEIGVNHEGCLEKAKKLVDDALEGGADAVKFQSYKAGTIAMEESPAYWDLSEEPTTSQFELFKKYDSFGFEEYEELSKYCEEKGIIFSSTPFDFESADYLDDLMPFYKVSSSDITNLPFLKHIAKKNKPVILSTGAANLEEIGLAVKTIRENNSAGLALLHCILNYPCKPEMANLNTIKLLKDTYPELCIGYSDHVAPDPAMLTLIHACLLGAVIIEKHFTDDKGKKGNDHYHSMDKDDLKIFRKNLNYTSTLAGSYHKDYLENEAMAREHARRSIVALKEIKEGEQISWDNITYKRPAHGISPALAESIVGVIVNCDIKADSLIKLEYLKVK